MSVLVRKIAIFLTVFMLLTLTIAASAQPIRSNFTLASPAKLGGAELKAGDYNITADDTKVTLKVNGKVVAEAKVEWKDGASKASQTSLLIAGDEIKEFRFEGKTRYAVVQ